MKLFCKTCGREYDSCPTCENAVYFAWRNSYCSIKCFKKGIMGLGKMIVQYKGKTYGVKEYDYKKGVFLTTNDLELTEEDIEVYTLPKEKYEELKYGRFTRKKKIEVSENDKLEFGEEN